MHARIYDDRASPGKPCRSRSGTGTHRSTWYVRPGAARRGATFDVMLARPGISRMRPIPQYYKTQQLFMLLVLAVNELRDSGLIAEYPSPYQIVTLLVSFSSLFGFQSLIKINE